MVVHCFSNTFYAEATATDFFAVAADYETSSAAAGHGCPSAAAARGCHRRGLCCRPPRAPGWGCPPLPSSCSFLSPSRSRRGPSFSAEAGPSPHHRHRTHFDLEQCLPRQSSCSSSSFSSFPSCVSSFLSWSSQSEKRVFDSLIVDCHTLRYGNLPTCH